MEEIDKIRANAELAATTLAGASDLQDFGFNAESVEWLDGYIESVREHGTLDDEGIARLQDVLGSFLGECIVRCHGGDWKWEPTVGEWCVYFGPDNAVFPFTKVAKQFEHGHSDSVWSFFDMIPAVFKHRIRGTRPRRWWRFWEK